MSPAVPTSRRAPAGGSLGRRLAAVFLLVLALSLVGAGIGIWSLQRIGQSIEAMVERSVAHERLVADGLNKIQPGQPVRVAGASGTNGAPGKAPAAPSPAAYPQGARPAAARPAP